MWAAFQQYQRVHLHAVFVGAEFARQRSIVGRALGLPGAHLCRQYQYEREKPSHLPVSFNPFTFLRKVSFGAMNMNADMRACFNRVATGTLPVSTTALMLAKMPTQLVRTASAVFC